MNPLVSLGCSGLGLGLGDSVVRTRIEDKDWSELARANCKSRFAGASEAKYARRRAGCALGFVRFIGDLMGYQTM